MIDSIFEFKPVEPDTNAAEMREGKCLVLFVHGKGMVLTWMAGVYMADFIGEGPGGREGEPFPTDDVDFDVSAPAGDGLFVGQFRFIDTGPESWEMPHIHDYCLGIRKLRPATADEWESYRNDEWPWEPLKGSRFYDELTEDGQPVVR